MSMPTNTAVLRDWALWYAAQGIPVFPAHTPTAQGCSCQRAACPNIGKHPRTRHGLDDATLDPEWITRWWTQWPEANIGLLMGVKCWALDVDPRKGGDDELYNLIWTHGELPSTPVSHTGGGGQHYLFALVPGQIRTRVDIAPGIDVKGSGGYIIAPPSLHASGRQYVWDVVADLENTPYAQAPEWLLALCQSDNDVSPLAPDAPIPDGKRNNTLSRMAYAMRRAGMALKEILAGLEAVNTSRCQPPLDQEELQLIVEGKRGIGPDPVLKPSIDGKDTRQVQVLPPLETLTDLLNADIPPPRQLFHGLMHEGMLLFGGKSKRGKSWLIFDCAIALATGKSAFQQFVCHEPAPVLYLALEDGRARLQARAKAIQPQLKTANDFHLRYTFPPLAQDGIKLLADEIYRHKYGLVIIDVLAKLEPPKQGKGDKTYHDIYEMFGPLQDLRKEQPFCLTMLTHLRKQEAEDVFDALLGSVAYQGAQDVLWVLERKPKEDYAFLHIRDKDAEDNTLALQFVNGHWEYRGEGEEFEISRDERKVVRVLSEEGKEMSVQQILKAAGFADVKYGYVRRLLVSMVKGDLIYRTRHGNYSATLQAAQQFRDESSDKGVEI